VSKIGASRQNFWMLGSEDPLTRRQQSRKLITRPSGIPSNTCPLRQVGASRQNFWMLGSEDPLTSRQQSRKLITRPSRVSGVSRPEG
jgi:hypothetical protein